MTSTILDNSILEDVKKALGLPIIDKSLGTEDYLVFDQDLLIFINSVFNIVKQLGVGPKTNFSIASDEETWGDFFNNLQVVEMVRAYMVLKVRMQFDPPTGAAAEAYKAQIAEYEWRMNVDVETPAFVNGE